MCGVKETQCTHCNHLQVCSFKAQFRFDTGDRSFVNLRDISWIRPVSLECSYFSGKVPIMRDTVQNTALLAAQASAVRFMEDSIP